MLGNCFVLLIMILLSCFLLVVIGKDLLFSGTIFFGPVFVPSAEDKLKLMLELAEPKPGEKIVDLGSGDGKILVELARKGYQSEGMEINPILVRRSRKNLRKLRLEQWAAVRRANFWKSDFSSYDLVFLYGMKHVMKRLEKKMLAELKPGARVVSNYFRFPDWRPEKVRDEVRLYRR
ncbi:MAG: methyltransferase domain-containing protein [Candidatus Pacebacteria bacterium]|nr:methyltransferase domain-containing protein [Candidatus Paceibacterota bacterium]